MEDIFKLLTVIYQFTGLNFEQACCFNVDVGIISIVCSDTRMYITGVGAYFGAQCEKHGMLVRVAGDNIMMSPPFIMSHEQVEEVTSQQITFCSCHLIKLKKGFFKFGIWTRKKITKFFLLNMIVEENTSMFNYPGFFTDFIARDRSREF